MKMIYTKAELMDAEELMTLYREAMKETWCTWNDTYPTLELVQSDIARNALFKLENDKGEIIAAISLDEDMLVEELRCWSRSARPATELARLVVRADYRNQGLARILLDKTMKEARSLGYRSVHFLVSKTNDRAIRSYAKLKFENVGESELFGEHWWCYEKAL